MMMPLPSNVVRILPRDPESVPVPKLEKAKATTKRTPKMVPLPVASACCPSLLPDPNDKPLPAVIKWRNAVLGPDGPRHATTRYVLLTLSYHMSADGDSCFPSHEKLAEETGLSVRCIFNQLKLARAEQWVVVTKKTGVHPWKYNSYEASVPTYQDTNQLDYRHLGPSHRHLETCPPVPGDKKQVVRCR